MIRIDRKVIRDILKMTNRYDEWILYDPALNGYCFWSHRHPDKSDLDSSVAVLEAKSSLLRLEKAGMIKRMQGISGGGMIFHITAELLHRKAFWFDRTGKPFIIGFLSGVGTTVISGLILFYFTGLF